MCCMSGRYPASCRITWGCRSNVALAIVTLNGFFYTWHTFLGDPVVPGWITPAIPLLVAYCLTFPEGQARMQALCAFEITLGVFSIILGVTGIAGKLVNLIPPAIKSGVILGAGISAIYMIFNDDTQIRCNALYNYDLSDNSILSVVLKRIQETQYEEQGIRDYRKSGYTPGSTYRSHSLLRW